MELKKYTIKEIPFKNLYGRVFEDTDAFAMFSNGYAIEVAVTGSEFIIDLESDFDTMDIWVAYEINGSFIGRMMLTSGNPSICLFRNMDPNAVKHVKFYRETQAMNGEEHCSLLAVSVRSDGEFKPIDAKNIRIEFIGDSITTGEGTFGAKNDMDWVPMYMSFTNTYPKMICDSLNADYHIISQSGWGVFTGWDNDFRHNIPSIYEKVCGVGCGEVNEKYGSLKEYDFNWQPDIIIVNLGTNDSGSFKQPEFVNPDTKARNKMRTDEEGEPLREDVLKIEKAVEDFLETLRKRNPEAFIIWAYGMVGYDMTDCINEAINAYKLKANDRKVAYLGLIDTDSDKEGSRMHPGIEAHKMTAYTLTEYISKFVLNK